MIFVGNFPFLAGYFSMSKKNVTENPYSNIPVYQLLHRINRRYIDCISSRLEIPCSIYLVAIYKIVHAHLTFSETFGMNRNGPTQIFITRRRAEVP
jgi:hypothetical protein